MMHTIYWTVLTVLLVILELPLILKFIQCNKNFDIIRQVSVTILIIALALFVYGIGKLGLLLAGFVIR